MTTDEKHQPTLDDTEDERSCRNNLWIERDLSSGRFVEAKKRGGSFKGIRRER